MHTAPVVLPKIYLDFDWPTQIKIPRTVPGKNRLTSEKQRHLVRLH